MNKRVPVISGILTCSHLGFKTSFTMANPWHYKKKTYQLKVSICLYFFFKAGFTYSEMLSYKGYSSLNFDECVQFCNDYPVQKIGHFHDPRKVPPAHLKATTTPFWSLLFELYHYILLYLLFEHHRNGVI